MLVGTVSGQLLGLYLVAPISSDPGSNGSNIGISGRQASQDLIDFRNPAKAAESLGQCQAGNKVLRIRVHKALQDRNGFASSSPVTSKALLEVRSQRAYEKPLVGWVERHQA